MKIIYDNTIFNLQKYGGIPRYFSEITKRIREYEGVEIHITRVFTGKLSRLNNILMDYRLRKVKFDIYHPTYYSYALKKIKHVKTVITVHDMIHELYLYKMSNFQNDILMKRKSILSADHIICVSNNTKKDLKKIYNIDDTLISVIYHGSPVDTKKIMKDKYSISDKPYILYVGKRVTYKNFKTLLKAFHLLNLAYDFNLVCFGGGDFSNKEISEFKNLKLENSIKYIYGAEELLQYCYENAALFVYPSLYEGFGFPVLEAMAFGCPVIASNKASIPEIVNGAALLFSPDSVEELCNCVKDMLNNKDLRLSFIEKGKRRCGDFSWDKTALETFNTYQKLLN